MRSELVVDLPVDVMTIDVKVGVVINALTDAIINVVSGLGVEVLSDVNGNVLAAVMTDLEFAMPVPFKELIFC